MERQALVLSEVVDWIQSLAAASDLTHLIALVPQVLVPQLRQLFQQMAEKQLVVKLSLRPFAAVEWLHYHTARQLASFSSIHFGAAEWNSFHTAR
jgi:hypothetical protein